MRKVQYFQTKVLGILFLIVVLFLVGAGIVMAIPVKCGDHTLGNITFSNYEVRYGEAEHTGNRKDTDTWGGANLDVSFTFDSCPPGMSLRDGLQFRWLQIVTTDSPVNDPTPDPPDGIEHRGQAPTTGYVDPWSMGAGGYEDNKPFYYTDDEWKDHWNEATKTLSFWDRSCRPFGNAVDWQADLNLVCTWDKTIHAIGYATWGWDMAANPTPDVTLDPAILAWHAGASTNLAGIVNDASEFGNAWKFTNDCCCVPEPASGLLCLVGLAILGIYRRTARLRYHAN